MLFLNSLAALADTQVGRAAGSVMAKSGLAAYGDFAKENPRAARNIESVVNLAAITPAAKAAPGIASKTAETLGEIKMPKMAAKAPKPTAFENKALRGMRMREYLLNSSRKHRANTDAVPRRLPAEVQPSNVDELEGALPDIIQRIKMTRRIP